MLSPKINPHKRSKDLPARLSEQLAERIHAERGLANRNYFLYLSSLLRKTQIYRFWRRYLDVFRKFRLISLLFRIYSYLLVLLQLGTAFFIIILGFLILLPLVLLGATTVAFSALVFYRRENQRMRLLLKGQRIVVFFPTLGGELDVGTLWRAHIEELSLKENTTVLIVSPHFWLGKGLTGKSFYFLLRKEAQNVYILRKHYYFSLRRAVLDKNRALLTLIY
ncbi:MAG: hypothetical protein J6D16_02385 [Clostridia bacterium]|nr:hypothetical protein [Clostridia bacterium]